MDNFKKCICAMLAIIATALSPLDMSRAAGQHHPDATHEAQHTSRRVSTTPLREMGGTKVNTEYFTLTIPNGWSMPQPVKQAKDRMSALFGSMDGKVAVTFNAFKAGVSARQVADGTLANMRKSGLTTGKLVKKNGMWFASLTGKARGVAWFGENNGICGATMILGVDKARASELLKALRAKVTGIFPATVR